MFLLGLSLQHQATLLMMTREEATWFRIQIDRAVAQRTNWQVSAIVIELMQFAALPFVVNCLERKSWREKNKKKKKRSCIVIRRFKTNKVGASALPASRMTLRAKGQQRGNSHTNLSATTKRMSGFV